MLFLQNKIPSPSHQINIRVLSQFGDERPLWEEHKIEQSIFSVSPYTNFTIFLKRTEFTIFNRIDSAPHFYFGDFVQNSRGVEIGKKGLVYQCPHCKKWSPWPRWKPEESMPVKILRNLAVPSRWTTCARCAELILENQLGGAQSIIAPSNQFSKNAAEPWMPLLAGDDIHPCSLVTTKYINLDHPGIKYKKASLYAQPKILLRKTGKGIRGAIDYEHRYTVQVVYIFYLKTLPSSKSIPESDQYSLEFLFGVITSPIIEKYYYARFSNPKQKAFPHLIQANILALPIPEVNFSDLHSDSMKNYQTVINCVKKMHEIGREQSPTKFNELQKKSNRAVKALFGLDP